MAIILSYAVAKVNLMLRIYEKLPNGYHNMQSIFAFLPDIVDKLLFDTSRYFSDDSANIHNVPSEKNLIKQAALILSQNFDFPIAHVEIEKNIPIEAGLGGGSSDCASFINTIFNFWHFSTKQKFQHIDIFKALGADTRIFLHKYFFDENLLYLDGSGISGTIHKIQIPELQNRYILVVNNGTRLSTKTVFQNYHCYAIQKLSVEQIDFQTILNFENSLETSAKQLNPSLDEVLFDIKTFGAEIVGISGSGSSCFGLFDSVEEVYIARQNLSKKYSFAQYSKILYTEQKNC